MRPPAALLAFALVVVTALSAGCPKSANGVDAAAPTGAVPDDAPPLPVVRDDATSLLFSFVDPAGRVLTVPTPSAVPEAVRKRVLVVDLDKTPEQRQAHRYAFFADLTSTQPDGTYPVVVVSRYDATRGANAGAPPGLPAPEGSVVVYSADWCGYCKKAKAWMKEHEVPYIERDVDKTPGAAAELAGKLKAAGVPGGGIPVTDWAGSVVVGFDLPAFQRLLKEKPPAAVTAR
ncbi:MAG: glutaredoxin domain-containing protein [Deltaproteobacteria bacterium]|nr:glutaredoxin domain-containing protein [Deltaproteobacteria bacterium]